MQDYLETRLQEILEAGFTVPEAKTLILELIQATYAGVRIRDRISNINYPKIKQIIAEQTLLHAVKWIRNQYDLSLKDSVHIAKAVRDDKLVNAGGCSNQKIIL
jgi:hypothetical protein